MSEFWAILWIIVKYGFFIGLGLFVFIGLIIVFHPIYLTLSGRGSLKGQRGELKVSYFFGLLRLRYMASAHTQDLWLEIWKFKKLIQRDTVVKNKEIEGSKVEEKEEILPPSEKNISSQENIENKENIAEDDSDNKSNDESDLSSNNIEENTLSEKKDSESVLEKTTDIQESKDESDKVSEEDDLNKEINEDSEEHEKEIEDYPKVEATPEQLAQLQEILEEEEKKEKEKEKQQSEKEAKADEISKKLLKMYNTFKARFKKFKTMAILIKEKWESLWPVVKRFWNRGKKGFVFHSAYLKIEYSLDEHYLTGMFFGYIAPTIGFAKRYGLDFEPVPVFPSQPKSGVYSKASWKVDILPYKLIWAVTTLLFEKNIYKEIIWLYKMKKEKKGKNKQNNK